MNSAQHNNESEAFSEHGDVHGKAVEHELAKGSNLSIICLVDTLIEHAHAARASDIHIDPSAECVEVRFRVDGILQDAHQFPLSIHHEVVSRVKIMSGLRTDEHQMAQDGRFRMQLTNKTPLDVRVSIVPLSHGENVVLRLLSDDAQSFSLESLGFTEENIAKIVDAIKKPYGMILATGPTGSGKTTTLYTLIKMLNAKNTSILTMTSLSCLVMATIVSIRIFLWVCLSIQVLVLMRTIQGTQLRCLITVTIGCAHQSITRKMHSLDSQQQSIVSLASIS